jgi:predicted dehydrogenase
MTWIMQGQAPQAVTAVTQRIKPEIYPNVDDEANVILTYPKAVAILQPSWNWPYSRKDMEVYGTTGDVKTVLRDKVIVRHGEAKTSEEEAVRLPAPYDDSLHYLTAIVRGNIEEGDSLSSLKTNIVVSEILDAARQSAKTGKTVSLPLDE